MNLQITCMKYDKIQLEKLDSNDRHENNNYEM